MQEPASLGLHECAAEAGCGRAKVGAEDRCLHIYCLLPWAVCMCLVKHRPRMSPNPYLVDLLQSTGLKLFLHWTNKCQNLAFRRPAFAKKAEDCKVQGVMNAMHLVGQEYSTKQHQMLMSTSWELDFRHEGTSNTCCRNTSHRHVS